MAGQAQALGLAQGAHGFRDGDFGIGPMDKQKIDAGTQATEAVLDGFLQRPVLDKLGPDLGGDEYLLAAHTRRPDALSHCGFIVIALRRIDMAKASLQSLGDNLRALLPAQFPGAAPQFWNTRSVGGNNFFHEQNLHGPGL